MSSMWGLKASIILGSVVLMPALASAACPAGTESRGVLQGREVCALRGKLLNQAFTLTAGQDYVLEGGVYVGDDNKSNAELYIEPGVKIYGQSGADFLVVTRGSKIFAQGTAQAPIVFTSAKASQRKRGEWGGLVLNGNAPLNVCKSGVCEAEGEGNTGKYGGSNPDDNSGVLKYVRVEFAGFPVSPDNELNGITFNAVGRGTEVDFIQVHMNADDGIEFFGGTVGVKHVVLTGNEDDSLDWDYGWQGKAQFVLIQQFEDSADNGFESDNNKNDQAAEPRSMPMISNVTMIGAGTKGSYGMLLRKGTGALLSNMIITNFAKAGIDIDDNETFRHGGQVTGQTVTAAGLRMENSIVFNKKNFEVGEKDGSGALIVEPWLVETWFKAQAGNMTQDPMLVGYLPSAQSPAIGAGVTPDDSWFDFVDYIGAFADESDDWAAGWIQTSRD
jgi:hypothetical protein